MAGETCPTGGSFPADYRGALFLADYTRDCIQVMRAGANGLPDPANRATFAAQASNPVDLGVNPATGELWYADFQSGTAGAIRKLRFAGANTPPPHGGRGGHPDQRTAPLTVSFSATGSSDPDPGATLRYAWDLDDDGAFDHATGPRPAGPTSSRGPDPHAEAGQPKRRVRAGRAQRHLRVHLVSGDPTQVNSVFRVTVEGVLVVSGTPTSVNRWVEGTATVTVSDGRLTIRNGSGANNKLNYLDIERPG